MVKVNHTTLDGIFLITCTCDCLTSKHNGRNAMSVLLAAGRLFLSSPGICTAYLSRGYMPFALKADKILAYVPPRYHAFEKILLKSVWVMTLPGLIAITFCQPLLPIEPAQVDSANCGHPTTTTEALLVGHGLRSVIQTTQRTDDCLSSLIRRP